MEATRRNSNNAAAQAKAAPRRREKTLAAMVAALWLVAASTVFAQPSAPHYWHAGNLPPGAIGARRLERGGPVVGQFQPVEFKMPFGVGVAMAAGGQFQPIDTTPFKVGLAIGSVYRLRLTDLPLNPGMELFPTVEVIDRVYAPPGQEARFAVPIELSKNDIELALAGKFVTRVVYLEDPLQATPARSTAEQNWFDIGAGRDPLAVADALGRPVAIVRVGGRVPSAREMTPDSGFFFGSPAWVKLPSDPRTAPQPESVPAPALPLPPESATRPNRSLETTFR